VGTSVLAVDAPPYGVDLSVLATSREVLASSLFLPFVEALVEVVDDVGDILEPAVEAPP